MNYDAIIFDCDGVLINSEPIAVAILVDDLLEIGLRISEEEVHHRFTGWKSTQIAEIASAETGVPVPDGWVRRHVDRVSDAVAASVEPIPGILAVLDALDSTGVPWGVASQSGLAYLERALGRVGIWERAAGRVASSQIVANPKPAPDVYLKAMELVGVPGHHSIVVEDSPTGVRAGVAAGARVIGYASDREPHVLIGAGASHTVGAMADLHDLLGLSRPVPA